MPGIKQGELILATIVAGVAVWFITRELEKHLPSLTPTAGPPAAQGGSYSA